MNEPKQKATGHVISVPTTARGRGETQKFILAAKNTERAWISLCWARCPESYITYDILYTGAFKQVQKAWLLQYHLFLDVLDQERWGTQVVHWKTKEALDLLLMQIHGDDVRQSFGIRDKDSESSSLKFNHFPQPR